MELNVKRNSLFFFTGFISEKKIYGRNQPERHISANISTKSPKISVT